MWLVLAHERRLATFTHLEDFNCPIVEILFGDSFW